MKMANSASDGTVISTPAKLSAVELPVALWCTSDAEGDRHDRCADHHRGDEHRVLQRVVRDLRGAFGDELEPGPETAHHESPSGPVMGTDRRRGDVCIGWACGAPVWGLRVGRSRRPDAERVVRLSQPVWARVRSPTRRRGVGSSAGGGSCPSGITTKVRRRVLIRTPRDASCERSGGPIGAVWRSVPEFAPADDSSRKPGRDLGARPATTAVQFNDSMSI